MILNWQLTLAVGGGATVGSAAGSTPRTRCRKADPPFSVTE